METRYPRLLCALVASVAVAANLKNGNSSSTVATKLSSRLRNGHPPQATLVLPHGGAPSRGLDAALQSELAGVMSFAAQSPDESVELSPSAVEKMERAVTDLVTNVGAATPMGKSVKQIKDLIQKTMLPKIGSAHDANQKELDRLAGDVGLCQATKSNDEQVANVEKALYEKASPLHKQCRAKEAALATEAFGCTTSIRSAKMIRDLKCNAMKAYEKSWGSQAKNGQIIEKGGGETPRIYMKRLHDTYCGSGPSFFDKYVELETDCAKATQKYARLEDGCKNRGSAYKEKLAECDNIQSQMDGAACNRAVLVKDSCESYAECFNSRKIAFFNSKKAVGSAEKDRKAEHRALKRMVCLIDAFRDGKVQKSEVEECKGLTHDTYHLDILYPEPADAISCVVPNRYPATAEYKKVEFAPLPALAKGKVDANECYGVLEISTKPKAGSPRSCKCQRVTLNGPYSPGALVKCTDCLDVYRSTEKDSCPDGTKIFSPRSRSDWHTFLASASPLANPHWIVDVTSSQNGCGGCKASAMNSGEEAQRSWMTGDGSPWWLRSTISDSPSSNYGANCFLGLSPFITNENSVSFTDGDGGCSVHSRSYYCQQRMISTTPKSGSPDGCQCARVELTGRYSPGALLKCVGCLRVSKSSEKDSCPEGTKLFSPRSREDWRTVIDSAGPLRAPNWIVDVTRPENGIANHGPEEMLPSPEEMYDELQAAMNFETPQQASWRTQDGSPWWLRSTEYSEPSGDYQANCYMDLSRNPNNADSLTFDDRDCDYSSSAYYCQPRQVSR